MSHPRGCLWVVDAEDVNVHRLAGRQLALITRRQALVVGMTARQLNARVAAGLFVAVHRGVYRVAAAPTTPEQALLAACLAAGASAVASHRSAAVLWSFRGLAWPRPEITVAGNGKPIVSGVVVHRSRLDRADVGRRGPIPVTRPARTLLDLAGVEPELVEGALDDALVRGLTTLGSVDRMLARAGGHGRAGTALVRDLVGERQAGRRSSESPLEDRLIDLLRGHGLPEPVRQHEVVLGDGSVARLDLAYPDLKLGIEADGRIWHSGRADFSRDRHRANRLAGLGWTLLRYGWADLDRGRDLVHDVARMLDRRSAETSRLA